MPSRCCTTGCLSPLCLLSHFRISASKSSRKNTALHRLRKRHKSWINLAYCWANYSYLVRRSTLSTFQLRNFRIYYILSLHEGAISIVQKGNKHYCSYGRRPSLLLSVIIKLSRCLKEVKVIFPNGAQVWLSGSHPIMLAKEFSEARTFGRAKSSSYKG